MSFKAIMQRTVPRKFKEFCNHCTLHGVYYLCDGSRWWVHTVWVLIITASLLLCCYLSHMIWESLWWTLLLLCNQHKLGVNNKGDVQVETTHYSTADIPFPAVTVCHTDAVYGPNADNITQLLSLRGFNKTQISEFFQSFSEVKLRDYTPKSYVKKMHFLLEDLGYPLSVLLLMLKKPCEDLVVECSWRSRLHNCSEMFRPVYTIMGYCCQFDIRYFRNQVGEEISFVSGVQETEALEIMVDGQKISADGEHTNGYALLYVFDEQDSITFMNNAVMVTPAAYFDVNVYLWAIDSSPYVKALDLNKRMCILETDVGATSYQECMTRVIMRKVVEECMCVPFDFSAADLAVDDYSVCTWDRLICIYQNIETVQANIRLVTDQTECFQKCDYVQYSTEVEFIKNHRSFSQPANSQSKVAVHFSETTCMKYRREVLYTWDQMLANLGGIFGLCLGGSIISVIEILWFIFDIIFTVTNILTPETKFKDTKKNKHFSKKLNAKKVFVLNQNDLNKVGNKNITNVVTYKYTN